MDRPGEREALDKMKAEVAELKENTWSYLEHITRYTEEDMIHSGYRGKTKAEALYQAFISAQKRKNQIIDKFLKLYPD